MAEFIEITFALSNTNIHSIVPFIRIKIGDEITFGEVAKVITDQIGHNVVIGRLCGDEYKSFHGSKNVLEYVNEKIFTLRQVCIFQYTLTTKEILKINKRSDYRV